MGDSVSIPKKQCRFLGLEIVLGFLNFLIVVSFVFLFGGCGLLESRKKPRIEEVPPYYQHNGSSEFRSYHDRERENMASQVHIVRNREMERLTNSEKDDGKKDHQWEDKDNTKTTPEKQTKFWDKFKITDKNFLRSDEAVRISSNLDR
jgi:hypothetical protein